MTFLPPDWVEEAYDHGVGSSTRVFTRLADVEQRQSVAKRSARFLLQASLGRFWLILLLLLPRRLFNCQEVTGVKHDLLQRPEAHLKVLLGLRISERKPLTARCKNCVRFHERTKCRPSFILFFKGPPHLKSTHSSPAVISPSHSLASQLSVSMMGTIMTSLVSA